MQRQTGVEVGDATGEGTVAGVGSDAVGVRIVGAAVQGQTGVEVDAYRVCDAVVVSPGHGVLVTEDPAIGIILKSPLILMHASPSNLSCCTVVLLLLFLKLFLMNVHGSFVVAVLQY